MRIKQDNMQNVCHWSHLRQAERVLRAFHLAGDEQSLGIHVSVNDGHRFDGS